MESYNKRPLTTDNEFCQKNITLVVDELLTIIIFFIYLLFCPILGEILDKEKCKIYFEIPCK